MTTQRRTSTVRGNDFWLFDGVLAIGERLNVVAGPLASFGQAMNARARLHPRRALIMRCLEGTAASLDPPTAQRR